MPRESSVSEPPSSAPPRMPTTATVAAALVVAFCALLLAKWLAVAAIAALALFVGLRWLAVRLLHDRRGAPFEDDVAADDVPVGVDCSWCGRAGGHLDPLGRPLRPRHAHGVSRTP